jgi:hypothetical protein
MITKKECEFLRYQSKQKFDKVKSAMIDCGRWAAPWRTKWLQSQTEGERNNYHIVDPTHILALRSFVAGFLEGNTSATRPWYRWGTNDPDLNTTNENKIWLDKFTRRTLQVLNTSNFYHSAGQFYYDFGAVHTGAHYIDETPNGPFFHNLIPGAYFSINDAYGEAVILVREFSMTVKALVDYYGVRKKSGGYDWSNFSSHVKKMYEDSNYTQLVEVVHVITRNKDFDPTRAQALTNRQWLSLTYEVGAAGQYPADANASGTGTPDPFDEKRYLKIGASRRKPFIVGKSPSNGNFEWGETGPTLDALGLIKSLNKKAIGKDQALELMLRPPVQGPANLKKSYVSTAPNTFIPLDAQSIAMKGGLRSIYEVNPAIVHLNQDTMELRQMVDKIYYADYLLYLSRNPKTRTATETNAIVQEQQLIIGPNLQSLNWTYNTPVLEFIADYVLYEDPWVLENPPPKSLGDTFLRPEFISVFAQAQKAADLPSIDRYMGMIEQVGQLNPKIWDKVNIDRLADLYEDRLFLPAGLNNPQAQVEAKREEAQAQMMRQQMLAETLPAMAGAAKDLGLGSKQ